MKTHTKIALAVGVVAVAGVTAASVGFARGGFGHHGGHWAGGARAMIMEQFDANQDGKLTQSEIDESIRSRMVGADSNGDGQLDLEEFQPLFVEIVRPRIVDGFQFLTPTAVLASPWKRSSGRSIVSSAVSIEMMTVN